jgi:hypothetical protein
MSTRQTRQESACPHCGGLILIEGHLAGQTVTCPHCSQPVVLPAAVDRPPEIPAADSGMSNREVFNVVTDTVVGPNLRTKDNLYQAIAIGICLLVGAAIGAVIGLLYISDPDLGATGGAAVGAVLGGILGMILGLFGSGTFWAVYRLVRHLRGPHD